MYLAKCDALFVKILYIGINKKLNKPYYYVSNNCSAIFRRYKTGLNTKYTILRYMILSDRSCYKSHKQFQDIFIAYNLYANSFCRYRNFRWPGYAYGYLIYTFSIL